MERVEIRDERRERFVRTPLKMFLDYKIRDEHLCTYGALASFADYRDGTCEPSMPTIARRSKVGPRRVRRALRDFERWGEYVKVEWSRGGLAPGAARGRCHIFTLLDVPAMNPLPSNPVQTDRVQTVPVPNEPGSNGQGNERRAPDSKQREETTSPLTTATRGVNGRRHDPELYQLARAMTVEIRKDLADLYEGKGPDPESFGRDLAMILKMIKHYGDGDTRAMMRAGVQYREDHGKPISVPALYAVRDRLFHDVVKARENRPRPWAGLQSTPPVRLPGPRGRS